MNGREVMLLRWGERIYVVALALLVGAQVAVGYLVAPALFAVVPERVQAGTIAGEVFARLGWLSVLVLPLLIALQDWLQRAGAAPRPAWPLRLVLPAMLLLTLAGHLWLRPWIIAVRSQIAVQGGFEHAAAGLRAQFGALHGASSLVFLLVSLLGIFMLSRLRGPAVTG